MSQIPPDDRGLLLGDGLFETVLMRGGRAILWPAHVTRLQRGCGALGLPAPDADRLAAAAADAVADAGLGNGRAAVRLTWTAGSGGRGLARPDPVRPRLIATAAASPPVETPATLVTSGVRRNAGSPASRLKTLAYLDNVLARREATAKGADEALMLNTDGHLACAAAANLFWIADGRLFTPALDCGVLDGIMRAAVIAAARSRGVKVAEAATGPEILRDAESLFLTNSLIGLRPVSALDGRPYPGHALLEALQADCAAVA